MERHGRTKETRARLFAAKGECEIRKEGAKGGTKSRNDYPLLRITASQILHTCSYPAYSFAHTSFACSLRIVENIYPLVKSFPS